MVHAVSATFRKFEHMSPPAAGLALLLHVAIAALLIWSPLHDRADFDDAIEVTMEAPPEKKPEPEPPKPQAEQPKAEQRKPPPAPPPPQQQQTMPLPGLAPPGAIGPKSTSPPMQRGETTRELPAEKTEPPVEKTEPPQQALARPPEPPPPPPPLEKELPPVEAPAPPLTSRDIPRPTPPMTPPVPERKPEPPRPPQQAAPPRPNTPQLAPSPLSRLPNNTPSQRSNEPPRSTFVNPADTYAQNTLLDAYLQRVVYQVQRYRFDGAGLSPTDSVVTRFTIARNGALLAVSVVRPSGKPSLDRDAVTAFQQVAPFPPLPSEVSGDSHTFILTFYPGRGR